MDRSGPVAQLRAAVRAFAAGHVAADRWCVALSGGADSLALTAVSAALRPTTALIVDHGLQPESAAVAEQAQRQAIAVGCADAHVLRVDVGSAGGPEAAARDARYAALESARAGAPVLLAHTLDDQAETVLLGLGRGSGPRSLAGMRAYDDPWCRPLLGQRRSTTEAACADPRYTRVRVRTEVLPLLEAVLGGGVAEALARTAAALREDTEALDATAAEVVVTGDSVAVASLAGLSGAVRRRVIRGWLHRGGACDLNDGQIRAVDRLVTDWRGQGGVAVGSRVPRERLFAARRAALLVLYREPVR